MKRIVWGIAIFILIIGAVVFCVPQYRQSLFGISLRSRLEKGHADNVMAVSYIMAGNEIRGLNEEENPYPNPEAVPEVCDLRFGATEIIESSGNTNMLRYKVSSAKSHQIGSSGAGGVTGSVYQLRLLPFGLPGSLTKLEGKDSQLIDDVKISEIMSAWWPGFPKERVFPGSTWSARWEAPMVMKVLDGKKIRLQHRLNYKLDKNSNEKSMSVAKIDFDGDISPIAPSDLPEGVKVIGTGKISGTAYVNIDNGVSILSDDSEGWSVVIRFMKDNMEYVQFSDRKTRIYRPRIMPHADAGFDTSIDSEGGLPSAGGAGEAGSPASKESNASPADAGEAESVSSHTAPANADASN